MRQSSIFELRQRKRLKVEFVDLTQDTDETVVSHDAISRHVKHEVVDNPFLEESPEVIDVNHVIRSENVGLGTIPVLAPVNEEKVQEATIRSEAINSQPRVKRETSPRVSPAKILRSASVESDGDDILRFYDSDSDDDELHDVDYEFRDEQDIDLNYETDDEPEYCFKVRDEVPRTNKGRKAIDIDGLKVIELADAENESICPACHLYMGDAQEHVRSSHISVCIEEKGKVAIRPVLKTKAPSLIKTPSFKNRDPAACSPKRTIDPPKNLKTKSKKNPIPDLKILSFPKDPSSSYSVSMDAFNFAPNPDIQMYFLSHFHSDHYGGISKKWCYERLFETVDDFRDLSKYKPLIYCSEITGKLLTLKFGIDPRFIQVLEFEVKYLVKDFHNPLETVTKVDSTLNEGLYVTVMPANHCPGSAIFLFESKGYMVSPRKYLHCGDFRVNKEMLDNPILSKFRTPGSKDLLDKVYLDTTYLSFCRNFPKQELVCEQTSQMFHDLVADSSANSLMAEWFGMEKQSRITDFITSRFSNQKKKFLILVGTYVIGKERLAISISKKLNNCPIFVSNINSRTYQRDVVATCRDEHLDQFVTENELGDETCECVIHMVPMQIVFATNEISRYFYDNKYFDHFERCIGLRPTGWTHGDENYSRTAELGMFELTDISACVPMVMNQVLSKVLDICEDQPPFSYLNDILPKHDITNSSGNREKDCIRIYSLPYSEHSSYRELSYFCLFLNIKHIIPTVNTERGLDSLKMNNHIRFWKKLKDLRKNRDITVDPMISERIKYLTVNNF